MSSVRVGIVTWNSGAVLERCLAALPAALAGLDAEVVVIDNASGDESGAIARRHEGVRAVVNDLNVGYARAMNRALASEAEILIALNPDTEAPPGSLATLVERLRGTPDVGLVVPRLVDSEQRHQPSVYRFPSAWISLAAGLIPARLQGARCVETLWLEGGGRYDRPGDIDWAIGAVHVIRSAALGDRPPYTERWFMYGEDIEFCWTLARSGWRRRLEADVVVGHVGSVSAERAWGADVDRRWLPVSYDLYQRMHGRLATRGWALANACSVCLLLIRQVMVSLGSRRRWGARLTETRPLLRLLPIHLRTALLGAQPPDGSPPAESARVAP